jgi:AcrR family transcriptional regulator
MSTDDPSVIPRPPGRPRLYEPDDERDRILSAALEVLRRNEGEEATVADILQEAGLSTRAFYRHFETKEDVIRWLYERDARSFGSHLRRRVEAEPGPEQALETWVNEMLGLAYERRRAERVSALGSPMVLRVVGGTPSMQLGTDLLVEPLREVLEAGLSSGTFPAAQPELDSLLIRGVTQEAIDWARVGWPRLSRRESLRLVLRYVRPALGFSS